MARVRRLLLLVLLLVLPALTPSAVRPFSRPARTQTALPSPACSARPSISRRPARGTPSPRPARPSSLSASSSSTGVRRPLRRLFPSLQPRKELTADRTSPSSSSPSRSLPFPTLLVPSSTHPRGCPPAPGHGPLAEDERRPGRPLRLCSLVGPLDALPRLPSRARKGQGQGRLVRAVPGQRAPGGRRRRHGRRWRGQGRQARRRLPRPEPLCPFPSPVLLPPLPRPHLTLLAPLPRPPTQKLTPRLSDASHAALVSSLRSLATHAEVHLSILANLSPQERAALFSRARVVIGLGGEEGLGEVGVWMEQGGTVLEVFGEESLVRDNAVRLSPASPSLLQG